jgi:ornithine decarboxylase
VRVRLDDSGSVFPLSRKFGAEAHHARALLQYARTLGLQPYGATFHVGSQCVATSAWVQAIAGAGRLMRQLESDGIRLEMLDIGGGFPARYDVEVPSIEQIGAVVERALDELLPYRPAHVVAEPGRHLVAESAVMVASVLGREERAGEEWLYLDVGAYNGLMETLQTVGQWRFPLWSSRVDHGVVPHVPFTVTGPSCDSADTMFFGAQLPVTMTEGDRIFIGSAGAYTLSYASSFNGFPPPLPYFLD